ncbi:hypothetical protein GZH53_03555 [Flavihumibacter sp. R14]|nr:hypothetical protein [Flavihumibacter soli]
MKTLIIFLLCGCMLSANQAFAQKQKSEMLPVVTISAGSNVSQVVHDAFLDRFKNAEDLRWFQVNKNYLVKFIMEDQEHHAAFNKKGDMLYHIAYGVEKNLPPSVLVGIKSQYDNYKIGRVFNIDRDGRNVWIVNLESAKNFVITGVENNVISEITRFKNASAGGYSAVSDAN